jgi:hypothetical protein
VFDGKTCFTLNDSEVAAEVIDGEAILINLSTGVYYSLDKTGAVIWENLAKGCSFDATLNMLLSKYDASAEQIRADLERLASELCNERLILAQPNTIAPSENIVAASSLKETYESPKLHTYNDMGDLLALDPPMPKLSNVPWSNDQSDHR